MTVQEALKDAEQKMQGAVSVTQDELGSIRTGRANPKLLERLHVDYYGTQVPLLQLASTSVPKAIQASDLGLTPSNDGNVIRLAFPPLTEERRRDLIKMAKDRAEEGRVAVRNVRRHIKETLERLERDHAISEDDLRRAEKDLQHLTDRYVSDIDEKLEHKEQELREV